MPFDASLLEPVETAKSGFDESLLEPVEAPKPEAAPSTRAGEYLKAAGRGAMSALSLSGILGTVEGGIEGAASLIAGKPMALDPNFKLSLAAQRPLVGKIPDVPSVTPEEVGSLGKAGANVINAGAGVANAVIDFANFAQTPDFAAMLGIGGLPSAVRRTLLAGWGAELAAQAPQQLNSAIESAKQGDWAQATRAATSGIGGTIFASQMAKHALPQTPLLRTPPPVEQAPKIAGEMLGDLVNNAKPLPIDEAWGARLAPTGNARVGEALVEPGTRFVPEPPKGSEAIITIAPPAPERPAAAEPAKGFNPNLLEDLSDLRGAMGEVGAGIVARNLLDREPPAPQKGTASVLPDKSAAVLPVEEPAQAGPPAGSPPVVERPAEAQAPPGAPEVAPADQFPDAGKMVTPKVELAVGDVLDRVMSSDSKTRWDAWKEWRVSPGKVDSWVFAERYDPGESGYWKSFPNPSAFKKWKDEMNGEGIIVSDRAMPERTFYRTGPPPEDYVSTNRREGVREGGVSAYFKPEATSFAGAARGDWWVGKGRQVGIGSDGEPVVIPTEKWKPYLLTSEQIVSKPPADQVAESGKTMPTPADQIVDPNKKTPVPETTETPVVLPDQIPDFGAPTFQTRGPSGEAAKMPRAKVTPLIEQYDKRFAGVITKATKETPRGENEGLIEYRDRIKASIPLNPKDIPLLEEIVAGLETNSKAIEADIATERSPRTVKLLQSDLAGVLGLKAKYVAELKRHQEAPAPETPTVSTPLTGEEPKVEAQPVTPAAEAPKSNTPKVDYEARIAELEQQKSTAEQTLQSLANNLASKTLDYDAAVANKNREASSKISDELIDLKAEHRKAESQVESLKGQIHFTKWEQQIDPYFGQPPAQGNPKVTAKTLKTHKDYLLSELDKAIKTAPDEGTGKITIDIPGDGNWTIWNNRTSLKKFREIAEKGMPTTVTIGGGQSWGKAKGKAAPKVTEPKAEKLVDIAGEFTSSAEDRYVINYVYADGTQLVATDGRTLIRIVTNKAPGTPSEPVRIGGDGKADVEAAKSNFPNWKIVSDPSAEMIYGGMDVLNLLDIARQSKVFRDASELDKDKRGSLGVTLFVNADRSIGARMEIGGDVFEHNLQPNGKSLGVYNPEYLANAMDAARKLGNRRVDVYAHSDNTGPISFVGQNHETLVMPLRMSDTATMRERATQFLNVAGKSEHGRLPDGLGPLENPESMRSRQLDGGALGKFKAEMEDGVIKFSKAEKSNYKNHDGGYDTLWKPIGEMQVADWPSANKEQTQAVKTAVPGSSQLAGVLQKGVLEMMGERQKAVAEVEQRKAQANKDGGPPDASGGGIIGMGGAVPSEFDAGQGRPTSMRLAEIDQERIGRGLEPLTKGETVADQAMLDKAKGKMDADPSYADRLIAELNANPRAIEDWENHVLLLRKVELRHLWEKSAREAAQAYEDSIKFPNRLEAMNEANAQTDHWSAELTKLEQASRVSGSSRGRALRALRVMANEDYSLARMEMQKRADEGGRPLTPEERSQLVKSADEYKARAEAAERATAESETRNARLEAEKALAEAKAAAAESAPKFHPSVLDYAEKFVKGMEGIADKYSQELRGAVWSPTPDMLAKAAFVGAARLARLGLDSAKWTEAMVRELGEKFRPYAAEVYEASKKLLDEKLAAAKSSAGVKIGPAVKHKMDLAEQMEAHKARIEAKIENGDGAGITPQVKKLAEGLWQQGIQKLEPMIDSLHSILKETQPEITRQETMDALSGRGKFWQASQNEIKKGVRDLSTQARLVAHQMDVLARKPLPRTGYQPDKMSDAARREQQVLEDLKRRFGVTVTNPATQLASALSARKTYYTHRISDLKAEIKAREKTVKTKSPSPTDAALERLKAEYAQVKAEHDAMFPRDRSVTPEQQLKMATAAAERNAAEWDRRLLEAKKGNFDTRRAPGRKVTSAELEAIKARTEAVKAEVQQLKDLDGAFQERQRAGEIEASIAEYERRLKAGEFTTPDRAKATTPKLLALEAKREAARKALSDARNASPETQAKALKAVEDYGKELERRINEGDIAARKAGTTRPVSPEVAAQRAENAEMQKIIQQMRNAAKPKRTPAQIALQAYKTRTLNRIAELQERLAAGDFSKKPKRELVMDAEAVKAQHELELWKQNYEEARFKDLLAKRTQAQRVVARIAETIHVARAIKTSFDISGIGRQGFILAVVHPVRAAKVLPSMLRAMVSPLQQFRIERQIKSRENYPTYKRSGLYISERGQGLAAMEEAYMSRWADKIPGVAASQRAYTTFLNVLRADSFDAMEAGLSRTGKASPVEAQAIANYINVATGRGKFTKSGDNAAVFLNTVFFAPRFVTSRFQFLAGQPLYRGSMRTRKMIAGEYLRFFVGISIMYGLAKLAGFDVEDDLRSGEAGKIKVGASYVDPLAGLLQPSVLAARVFTGETKKGNGRIATIRGETPYGQDDIRSYAGRFGESKLSPSAALAWHAITGKDYNSKAITPAGLAKDFGMPLSFGTAYEVMKANGVPESIILNLLQLAGAGVQTYEE